MLVASFDLETSNLNANFGILLCAVIKPWEGPLTTLRVDELPGRERSDDSRLVKATLIELAKYPVLIAHNGVKFDRPFLNTRAIKHSMPVLNPRGNMIDPCIMARRHLRMSYNGLDTIAKYLQTEHQKSPVEPEKWLTAVIDRDQTSLDDIVLHCQNDVYVLEEVTQKMLPFMGRIGEFGSA